MDDGVVETFAETVRRATRAQAAAQEAAKPFLYADVARAFFTRVKMCTEFVGLGWADSAIEIEVNEVL